MRKILKRILCLTLIVLMLLPLLVACTGKKEEKKGSALDLETLAATMPDDGVGIQDYGGRTIRLLGWTGSCKNEFEVSEEEMQVSESTLKQAIYMRNEAVKGRLNVDLKWTYVAGASEYEGDYVSTAKSRLTSQKVDILTPYSRAGNLLMIQGYAQDLKGISTIRLDDPWWSACFMENASINDKIYFAAGDMSWTLMAMTFAFCYNKNILKRTPGVLSQFGVDSMYDLVMDGKWTLESMRILANAVTTNRTCGITGYHVAMDAFYKGCDLDWMEVDPATGDQIVSDDQNSGRANDVVRQLTSLFNSAASTVGVTQDRTGRELAQANNTSNPSNPEWQKGRSLFVFNSIISITDYKFNELSFDFGVLPMPMYDEEQSGYKTVPDFEYSMCVIPRQVSDADAEIFGAVLTVMASEGFMRTARAYYSEVLKKQSSNSVEDYNMWDTIKQSIDLDGGRLFDRQFDKCNIWNCFRTALANKEDSLAGQWASAGQTMIGEAEKINRTMRDLEAGYGNK